MTLQVLLWINDMIDDHEELRDDWEGADGIFVWHTSTKSTLEHLRKTRILKHYKVAKEQGGSSA